MSSVRRRATAAVGQLEDDYVSMNGRPMPTDVRAAVVRGFERAELVGTSVTVVLAMAGTGVAVLVARRLRR